MEQQSQDQQPVLDEQPALYSALTISYTTGGDILIGNVYVPDSKDSVASLAIIYNGLKNYSLIKEGIQKIIDSMSPSDLRVFIESINSARVLTDPILCPLQNNALQKREK
jgi:hypothetical protein